VLDDIIEDFQTELSKATSNKADEPDCVARNGTPIWLLLQIPKHNNLWARYGQAKVVEDISPSHRESSGRAEKIQKAVRYVHSQCF